MSDDSRYAEHYAIRARRDAVIADGGCSCCSSVIGRNITRATWRWHHTNGSISYLCDQCYDRWAQNVVDDPSLAPARVERKVTTWL